MVRNRPLLGILIGVFIIIAQISENESFFSWLGWLGALFLLIIGGFLVLGDLKRKQKIEKLEVQESLEEGGIEESQPFRDLTTEERAELEKSFSRYGLVKRYLKTYYLLIALMDLSVIYFFILTDDALFLFLLIPLIIIQSIPLITFAENKIRQRDLQSQVYRVQGKALFGREFKSGPYLEVRKNYFNEKNLSLVIQFLNETTYGQKIAVEFSPHTKKVWKIYKTEDLK